VHLTRDLRACADERRGNRKGSRAYVESALEHADLGPDLAGQRLLYRPQTGRSLCRQLDLGLLGYRERVVNVYAKVADRAFKLAVTE
jgi:hypothetical protein